MFQMHFEICHYLSDILIWFVTCTFICSIWQSYLGGKIAWLRTMKQYYSHLVDSNSICFAFPFRTVLRHSSAGFCRSLHPAKSRLTHETPSQERLSGSPCKRHPATNPASCQDHSPEPIITAHHCSVCVGRPVTFSEVWTK